jgi:hypothetical protein
MRKAIRIGGVLGGIVLLWLVLAWTGWLPRPSAEQRAALALLKAPREHAIGEHNAFGFFWLLQHDIDEAEYAAQIARDAAVVATWDLGRPNAPLPRDALPRRVPVDLAPLQGCGRDSRCLADVRANTDAVRAGLAARQPLFERLDTLGRFDHYRSEFPPTLSGPIPPLQDSGRLQILRAALRYVDGETDAALAGLCAHMSAWRRMKGRSDSLIFEMVGLAWVRDGAQLFADIRAELPPTHPLPANCDTAFGTPESLPRQSCDIYRGEFAMVERGIAQMVSGGVREPDDDMPKNHNILFNPGATAAAAARPFADLCNLIGRPVADWPSPATLAVRCGADEWMFNPTGCVLNGVHFTALYTAYVLRDRDAEGQLRALALADWLAMQPDPQSAFDGRPTEHRGFEQVVTYSDRELSIELLDRPGGRPSHWRIPLPGSRAVDGGAGASLVASGAP